MYFGTIEEYEEYVDYDIKNGLLSKDMRQNKINEMYKIYNEVLADLNGTTTES